MKQKRQLRKIIVAAVLFASGFVCRGLSDRRT